MILMSPRCCRFRPWLGFFLLLLSGSAGSAVEARIDLDGIAGRIASTDNVFFNLTNGRQGPIRVQDWRKPGAEFTRWANITLKPNQPNQVRIQFTPDTSGKVLVSLRGQYVADPNANARQPVLVWWQGLQVEGAVFSDEKTADDVSAWVLDGTPEAQKLAGVLLAPAWLARSGLALKVWHDASAQRTLVVTAGQRVTLTAWAGTEVPNDRTEQVYRTRTPGISETLTLTDGTKLEGEILDRSAKGFTIRTGGALREVPESQVSRHTTWRSALYPADWKPGFAGKDGAFLHDFSYAGYRRGEALIPDVQGPLLDVSKPPYGADPTGDVDSTAAIQKALDDAVAQGGAVVYLPAGTFRVVPPAEDPAKPNAKRATLTIAGSGVVVRGAGRNRTFVFNDGIAMHNTTVFNVLAPDKKGAWATARSPEVPLTADVPAGVTVIPVADASPFNVGDTVILREDMTDARIAELDMQKYWKTWGKSNPQLCRDVVAVDLAAKTVTLDAPTRLPVRLRDKARLFTIDAQVSGVGFEDFAIGNREHTRAFAEGKSGRGGALKDTADNRDWLVDDRNWQGKGSSFDNQGTCTWDLHASYLITLNRTRDSWIRRVDTYRPAVNTWNVHLLSNGFILNDCRFITIADCALANPQFVGGGGNGYLISLGGPDNLVRDCSLIRARHHFSHRGAQTSGNVITNVYLGSGGSPDWHMQLSPVNLAENCTVDDCVIEAWAYRGGGGTEHGHTTTETVLWNNRGERYSSDIWYDAGAKFIIDSNQYGRGYVIGTRGPAADIRVDAPPSWGLYGDDKTPEWVEGVGQGATLEPQSLYADQLARRLAREGKLSPQR